MDRDHTHIHTHRCTHIQIILESNAYRQFPKRKKKKLQQKRIIINGLYLPNLNNVMRMFQKTSINRREYKMMMGRAYSTERKKHKTQ